MDRETELPARDARLLAAQLTEDEFVGELQIHEHTGIDFLDAYRGAYGASFSQLPRHPLIESDNLTVDEDHKGKGLGSELILAGYAQSPWKNLKGRKVTEGGAATLRKAYRLAKVVTEAQREDDL